MIEQYAINDNIYDRWSSFSSGPEEDDHPIIGRDSIRFIPVASYLIETYRPDLYEAGYDLDYRCIETQICFFLTWDDDHSKAEEIFRMSTIAGQLRINPILLYNDATFHKMYNDHR